MGFHDLSREAKATRGDIAEPRTSRLPRILPRVGAKLRREEDEVTPVAVADPRCDFRSQVCDCGGEEGGRGWGAGTSSALDKFFYLLCARIALLLWKNMRC